jgi:hypothetical protein
MSNNWRQGLRAEAPRFVPHADRPFNPHPTRPVHRNGPIYIQGAMNFNGMLPSSIRATGENQPRVVVHHLVEAGHDRGKPTTPVSSYLILTYLQLPETCLPSSTKRTS